MADEQKNKYVTPPQNSKVGILKKIASVYDNLQPSYWKRKLLHQIILAPLTWGLYYLLMVDMFAYGSHMPSLLSFILTVIAVFFYPYSLYRYNDSLTSQLFNGVVFFGSFASVIFKKIGVLILGPVLASILSPIFGPLTWLKYKRKNKILGEKQDFE